MNNDQKAFKTDNLLKELSPLLDKKEFILPENIGLERSQGNEFVWDIIKQFNKDVIGCTTEANYKSKLKISEYLDWCVGMHNFLEPNNKLYTELHSTYIDTNIYSAKGCTTFKMPNTLTISDNTLVHRKIVKEYLDFKPNLSLLTDLKTLVDYYINNPKDFEFVRSNNRLKIKPSKTVTEINNPKVSEVSITPREAFNYPLDLTNSVLNCSRQHAETQSDGFYLSWVKFNFPKIEEIKGVDDKTFLQVAS